MRSSAEWSRALAQVRLAVFDFDGVMTDNAVQLTEDGREVVSFWRGDGIGLSAVRRIGIAVWVLSTETNLVVVKRCAKLGIPCRHGSDDKAAALAEVCAETGVMPEQTLYVGNDVNDATCLQLVGFPIVVGDAHPSVESLAVYRTAHRGGRGAVREVCDLLVSAHAEGAES